MNKTALVTGGGRGIGLGISRHLVNDGWNLAFCGMREAKDLADVCRELEATGANVAYFQADVSDPNDRDRLLCGIKERFGSLHLLVNNAGVAPAERADILDAGTDSFDRLVNINLKGPYFLTQLVANYMVDQKKADAEYSGHIINISSISAFVASVNRGDYCLTKAAVSMSTKLWAARLAEFNVGVYEIQPGIIQTDMTAGVTEKYDKFIAGGGTLEPRWGTPDDIGKSVASIARGDLPYGTGQTIVLDGGLTLPRL